MQTDPATPRHTVERVPTHRQEEALGALLAAGPSAAARFARQASSAGIRLDFMWCVPDPGGRYRLAVLAVPSVGKTAMVLATRARGPVDVSPLASAIASALEALRPEADLAQSLLEPERTLDIEACEQGGLSRIATLDYLERALPRSGMPEAIAAPPGWTILPAADEELLRAHDAAALPPDLHRELERVLEASYVDTLDCPGLAGMRATADVLDGHFSLGTRRRIWLVARKDGRALGTCMVNGPVEHGGSPAGDSAELVYLGLAPEARGKGVARALLSEALRACCTARLRTLSLAVDARNDPARALYASFGFTRTSARAALVRRLA